MTSRVSLGEICQFVGGGTPSRKIPHYWNGSIPWATVKDFVANRISNTAEFISQDGLNHSASKVVPSGTVLLVTRVGLGKVAMTGVELAINQDIKAILPSDDVLPEFLFWQLKYMGPEIQNKGIGATVKGVTLQDIKDLEIPLPSLDEQRRIVGILNRAARIEQLRKRAQEQLREFIPALFVKMFGDPVKNPMGWETRCFGELVSEFRYGTSKKCSTEASDRCLPILRIPNVVRNVIDWSKMKFAVLSDKEASALQLDDGDILFVRTNGNPEYIGRCATFRSSQPAAYASYLIRARLMPNSLVVPEYVAGSLGTAAMRKVILSLARTTAGNYNINIASLSSLSFPIPPLDRQYQYVRLAESVRSMIATVGANRKTTDLNATLMSQLLEPDAAFRDR